jgi:hypothetical protein
LTSFGICVRIILKDKRNLEVRPKPTTREDLKESKRMKKGKVTKQCKKGGKWLQTLGVLAHCVHFVTTSVTRLALVLMYKCVKVFWVERLVRKLCYVSKS